MATDRIADICLILEGTYPYVSGGVSTWVHQLINAFPEWTFEICYLGGKRDPEAQYKYTIPPNVIGISEIYLFDTAPARVLSARRTVPAVWKPFYAALRKLFVHLPDGSRSDWDQLVLLLDQIAEQNSVPFDTFWHDEQTWKVLTELYERYAADESFLHFFWSTRYLVEPLWKLAQALPTIPKARLYHTACTGYAGIASALMASKTGKPLLVSEHGIYLRERIQDIYRSTWIPEFMPLHAGLSEPLGTFRRLWISFFDLLGRFCYQASSQMVSLFGLNARLQEHFGADSEKITIIPNGIGIEFCNAWHEQRAARRSQIPDSKVVGFLGRVVPIKDVKTLLRAARLVCDTLPDARFWIVGPTDEDADYYQACVTLTTELGLTGQVEFLGLRRRDDMLPQFDIMVLTSISEGLPFVAIEAMASGIPLVSTDVGACPELVHGLPTEQPTLGPAGLIAEVGNAQQIARALVQILTQKELAAQMSSAGRRRAQAYYDEKTTLAAYRELYSRMMSVPTKLPSSKSSNTTTMPTPLKSDLNSAVVDTSISTQP